MAASSPVSTQFEQALSLHQQGDLAGARALYQEILAQDAGHFDALHLLGVIAAQSGDPARAAELIGRALAVDAKPPAAHYHYGLALRDLGRQQEALAAFGAVLARDPAHLEAWISQAETLQALQRHAEAAQGYDHALALQPDHAQARFARGILLQHLQRHQEALADYTRVLELQPDFPGAINNRALTLQAMQRHAEALDGFDHLLLLAPEHAPAHYARGLSLAALQRHEEALNAFDRALALQDDLVEAHAQRGRSLRVLGQAEAALAAYAQLLERYPRHAEGWFEHGSILQILHRDAQALASLDRALAIRPDFAEARVNRALALLALKRPEEALADSERALALRPDLPDAHSSRGLILGALKRHAEALDCYEHALRLRPDHAESHANRGHELERLHRLPEALVSFEHALALEPRNPDYLYGRGAVLHLMERHTAALACYDEALSIAPEHTASLANRGNVLRSLKRFSDAVLSYARLLEITPDHPYAMGHLLHAQLQGCDWSGWSRAADIEARVAAGMLADLPFQFLSVRDSAPLQQRCARLNVADAFPVASPLWRGERFRHKRVRLAYVSGDFGFHPVAHLMAELFETHDRSRFEVTAISIRAPGNAPFEERVQRAFEHFTDASAYDDMQVAKLLREQEIDIAVDLMGHTNLPRAGIFARRPVPVQVSYLGYAGTQGMPYMDYLITDATAVPNALARYYDEQLVYVPDSFMPRDTTVQVGAAPTRAAAGLPEHGFVFCCFNSAYKLNPPVFDVWMRILRKLPGSVLWLTDPGAAARENLVREASRRGVTSERLVFASKISAIEGHLARVSLADLFLDTLPYNAHTTASDALWAGVPLLTCAGEAFASRVAASLLCAAGLPELITRNLAEYEALALRLASLPPELAQLRARLSQRRSERSLFPTVSLCRHLEAAFERMHERSQQGLPPEGFSILN